MSNRNAIGFDTNGNYIDLCNLRLAQLPLEAPSMPSTQQIAIQDDARNAAGYLEPETIKLFFTSPPYANLLNRRRKNKSRRGKARFNEQYGAIEQYSQDPRDLGTLELEAYQRKFRIWNCELRIGLLRELNPKSEIRNLIGWPSNYITMGITFEYLLHFWRPQ
ncbi:MAG: hypothetical protein ACE5F6_19560 [Anaerolineae bacterium]